MGVIFGADPRSRAGVQGAKENPGWGRGLKCWIPIRIVHRRSRAGVARADRIGSRLTEMVDRLDRLSAGLIERPRLPARRHRHAGDAVPGAEAAWRKTSKPMGSPWAWSLWPDGIVVPVVGVGSPIRSRPSDRRCRYSKGLRPRSNRSPRCHRPVPAVARPIAPRSRCSKSR